MGKYYAYDKNGEYTEVYDLEKCLKAIRVRNERNEEFIKELVEENKRLKSDYYKDEEIKKLQNKIDDLNADYNRGFPITQKEEAKIKKWMKKHDEEVHGLIKDDDRLRAGGCIGGRYEYVFLPTTIGTIGKVKCSCGSEFVFQEMD